jgi:glucosamine-6-phosphate isomerase
MQIFIKDSYAEISALAAEHFLQLAAQRANPLICVASGDSPAGLYKSLAAHKKTHQLNTDQWFFLGLDEWLGMNGDDEGSCRYHLNNQFFNPLQIATNSIQFFDGRAADPEKECADVEAVIQQKGPIDITILGLGLNGHIGMNEPGALPNSRCRIAELAPETIQVGQKYFTSATELTGGLTMGIGTIVESKNIFLLVNGQKKAAIVKAMMDAPVSPDLPASFLRQHPGVRVYLDKEAAALLAATV